MQQNGQGNHREELSFCELIMELLKNTAWILLAACIAALVCFIAAKIANIGYYRSEFSFYAFSSSQDYTAEDVAEGYAKMAVTSDLLKSAAEETEDIPADYQQLKKWVDVVQTPDTAVVTVGVTMKDKDQAYELANAIASILPDYESYVQYGTITITETPEVADSVCRNSIKWTKWVVVGFSLTFLLMCLYICICALLGVPNRLPSIRQVLQRFRHRRG